MYSLYKKKYLINISYTVQISFTNEFIHFQRIKYIFDAFYRTQYLHNSIYEKIRLKIKIADINVLLEFASVKINLF